MFQIRYDEKTPPIGGAIRARAGDRHYGWFKTLPDHP